MANKLRFVIDTSTLFSALRNPDSKPFHVFDTAITHGTLLLSFPVIAEMCDVFNRPKMRKKVNQEYIGQFILNLLEVAEFVEITETVTASQDPKDNKFLELAVCGNAQYLISSDKKDLVSLHPFREISILTPHDFLQEFMKS